MAGPVRIQAGHVNIAANCDHGLRGETGAPHEAEYVAAVAAMISGAVSAHGLDCAVWDANANCDGGLMRIDWTGGVVALHCDGRDQSGFAVGVGNPTEDGSAEASKQLADALRSAYSAANPSLPDLSANYADDLNISEYYLFNSLSGPTPFVLIELGAIASAAGNLGPDQLYLYNHQHDVAAGVVNGILKFLGIEPVQTLAAEAVIAPAEDAGMQPADSPSSVPPAESSSLESPPASVPEPEPQPPVAEPDQQGPPAQFPEVDVPPLVGPPPALQPTAVDRIREHLTAVTLLLNEL